jgi:hypothetical protein
MRREKPSRPTSIGWKRAEDVRATSGCGAGSVFTLAQSHLCPGSPRNFPAFLVHAQSWHEMNGPVVRAPAPIRRSGRNK